MPRFKKGSLQVTVQKRNGAKWVSTYHSDAAGMKSARAWKKAGGKVLKISRYSGRRKNSGVRAFLKSQRVIAQGLRNRGGKVLTRQTNGSWRF